MKKKCFIFSILFLSALFSSCHKKKDPTPTNNNFATKSALINNAFILGGVTYTTNLAMEFTYNAGGHTYHVLDISKNAASSSNTTNTCQFWFNSKPVAGDYTVISFNMLSSSGIPSDQVMIAAYPDDANGVTNTYLSQDYATATTINVSLSGNNYIVAVTNPLPLEDPNTSDIKDLTTTATIP
jgi:hypothetical protein